MAAPGWLKTRALGTGVGPQPNETAGQANLKVYPQRRETSFYLNVGNTGHRKETVPAPNLPTEQPGLSDTLIKPILKQKERARKWERRKLTRSPWPHHSNVPSPARLMY